VTNEVLSSTESKKPKFFYGYIVVVAALIILVITGGTISSFGVFFKPLLTEFDWTRAVTSGAYSLYTLLFGFLGIIAGGVTDRFGPRLLAIACGLLLGLGLLLMSQISAVWQLYLFYGVIIGVGVSGGFVPMLSTVAKWFVKRRGLMTGVTSAGIGAGNLVMPLVATQLITVYGWRTAFIILGITAAVVMAVAAQFLRRDPSQVGQLPDGESGAEPEKWLVSKAKGSSLREAIHTRQFWMLCIIILSFFLGVGVILVHLVPYATDLGISAVSAASVLAIVGGISMVGRIGMGSIADRIGNKPALIIVCIIRIVGLLWLLSAGELWMFYLFAVVFGFSWGGQAVLPSPMVAELFGLRAHGAIVGTVIFVGTIGGAIGPILAGRIFDVTGNYQLAFLILVGITIIALILALLLRPVSRQSLAGNA